MSRVTRWTWLGVWWFTTACGFAATPELLGDDDGAPSGPGMGAACAWARHFNACALPAPPTQPLTLSDRWTINTTTATLSPMRVGAPTPMDAFVLKVMAQTGDGRDVVMLYTSSFRLAAGASLAVTGERPLVIAAESTIQIDGELDVSSHSGKLAPASTGPGASDSECAGPLDGSFTGMENPVGGGGGGGALAASGGIGGSGNGGGMHGPAGTLVAVPALLRAGCAGGAGGGGSAAAGGQGGGAVELAARASITVTGRINAGGAGGRGAVQSGNGGGGGGSGGLISFDAPTVTLAPGSVVAANGGGGGAGADDKVGGDGDDAPLDAASAVGGGGDGNAGGAGGALAIPAGANGASDRNGGGGGGGGSVGYILVRATMFQFSGAVVSPPARSL